MPHITVEYTDNIEKEANIRDFLKKINETLIAEGGSFKPGAIRSRAIKLTEYFVADGTGENDAFVHVTMKIASGRTPEVKTAACDHLFEMMQAHFRELYENRYLALSLELYEFGEGGTYKQNNIHKRYN
ncbi:5-carboxymethyl-2-hydroxymuconate Delta-isomerase [Virgibacillus flavescens]|uniref:5-carboxymethyl-2-hydroxymuconate Delta-isomerase n=1 Tax=Virgibacillus flavescens TaxID=1611422 RepID=UPI003D33257A